MGKDVKKPGLNPRGFIRVRTESPVGKTFASADHLKTHLTLPLA